MIFLVIYIIIGLFVVLNSKTPRRDKVFLSILDIFTWFLYVDFITEGFAAIVSAITDLFGDE